MNWKQINDRYPKAFLEWVKSNNKLTALTKIHEFVLDNICLTNCGSVSFYNHDLIYLPLYFDTLGIEINATGNPSKVFEIEIITASGLNYYFKENGKWSKIKYCEKRPKSFPDRLTATIAGAEKAFEIREAQFNEAQQ